LTDLQHAWERAWEEGTGQFGGDHGQARRRGVADAKGLLLSRQPTARARLRGIMGNRRQKSGLARCRSFVVVVVVDVLLESSASE
jgi:hypothetical protein